MTFSVDLKDSYMHTYIQLLIPCDTIAVYFITLYPSKKEPTLAT